MRRALTLVEVMLSLCIISIGILGGVELMARIVKTDASQAAASNWEDRMMKARERLNSMSWKDVENTLATGEIAMDDLHVSIKSAGKDVESPYPNNSISVVIVIKDTTGGTLAEVPALKIKHDS